MPRAGHLVDIGMKIQFERGDVPVVRVFERAAGHSVFSFNSVAHPNFVTRDSI